MLTFQGRREGDTLCGTEYLCKLKRNYEYGGFTAKRS